MLIEDDIKLDFSDVLIRPKRSRLESRSQVDLTRSFGFLYASHRLEGFGLMAANMDSTGTFAMARMLASHGAFTALHKFHAPADILSFFSSLSDAEAGKVFVTLGSNVEAYEAAAEQVLKPLSERHPPNICIDIANGYSEHFAKFISHVRERQPDSVIMAGNVCTPEMAEQLVLSGADIVKVGIGPGSVCTTRKMTGVGYPQLSAIIECADAAHGVKGHICGDGGCTVPGDVAKAFSAGADFVMLGGMLAGHDECGGEVKDGRMSFYGMSSDTAMNKYHGGVAAYRASEGKTVSVPYRGPVEATLLEIMGGVRSACTYVGAERIKEMPKRTTFIRVNRQLNTVYGND